jgi:hypothetical protein
VINGEARPGDSPGAGEWLSVNAAAKRLGITPKAVRNRIAREAIPWRPAGNQGRQVLVSAEGDAGPGASPGDLTLLIRLARLEERLAASEDHATSLAAVLEDVKRDRDQLRELLREAMRPWPVRMLEAFRRKR